MLGRRGRWAMSSPRFYENARRLLIVNLDAHARQRGPRTIRREVPRFGADLADLRRSGDLELGVALLDFVQLGDVPGTDPLAGTLVAEGEGL